jgi:hypothetical protein
MDELQKLGKQGRDAMNVHDLDAADNFSKQIETILSKIYRRGIQIKSQDLTLIDFPAVINGLPAYLCWKYGEDDLEYWHYLEDGFSGRRRLTGKEEILSPL